MSEFRRVPTEVEKNQLRKYSFIERKKHERAEQPDLHDSLRKKCFIEIKCNTTLNSEF